MTKVYDGPERRAFERTETDEAGTVVFPNGKTRVPCRVLNRSEGGVLLKIDAYERLPADFTLIFGEPETAMVCRIAWRIGCRVGCEFICQIADIGADQDYILPVASEHAGTLIDSPVLRHPLIVS